MRVETEPCPNRCVDGWICETPNAPYAVLDTVCPVCEGDTVVPVMAEAAL